LRKFTNVVLRERERERERGEALAIAAAVEAIEISEQPPSGRVRRTWEGFRCYTCSSSSGSWWRSNKATIFRKTRDFITLKNAIGFRLDVGGGGGDRNLKENHRAAGRWLRF
jgi:hypothetical protein